MRMHKIDPVSKFRKLGVCAFKGVGAGLMAAIAANMAVMIGVWKATGNNIAAQGRGFDAAVLAFLAVGGLVAWLEWRREPM